MRIPHLLAAAALLITPTAALADTVRINGQATLNDGRIFNVSARLDTDTNTATGKAVLINTNFSGDSGKGPYRAFIDITCGADIGGGQYAIGGMTTRTNDSNLMDAVFFIVSADGTLSRAFFWDGDPATTGDPSSCQFIQQGDFGGLEDPIRGGLNVDD